jgi:hypothetical protein
LPAFILVNIEWALVKPALRREERTEVVTLPKVLWIFGHDLETGEYRQQGCGL